MNTLVTSSITAILTVFLGWLSILIKNKIYRIEKKETEKQRMKRESFEKLLDVHSKKILGKHFEKGWLDEFSNMSNLIIVWASDKVLAEYALFRQNQTPELLEKINEYEVHFGKAILEFRKELGYKNKNNTITPKQIAVIYKAGWKRPL